mmetsp:Transcript_11863/g.12783  ORF Transcript_11863/g.12783 Transcript_11863/m.12783 type:complete len:423 (-) Transcript_11863:211-1479(-)
MAAIINIAGLTPVNDPAYRYKMPRITGKVEGRGNGIKTVLMNITDVADALKREAPEITKFFGCELGAQTTYSADNRAVVNGAHRDNDLQSHLSKYIENFVLCKNCRLPETHYKVKDGLISQKCLACGSKDTVDMTHKLTTFILAQHKRNKEVKKAAEKEKEKEGKDGKKEKKEKKEKSGGDEKPSKSSSKEVTTGEDGEVVEKKKSSKSKSSNSEVVPESVFTGVAAAIEEESESKVVDDCIERFRTYISNNPTAAVKDQAEELKNLQTMASLRPADRCIIYLGAVFTEQAITKNESEKFKDMLSTLAASEIQQRHLLAATEWFCGTRFPSLTRFYPKLLLQLYEAEVVEEDTFLAWAADTTRNEFTADVSLIEFEVLEALHAAASPFIKWLQEAEEEGEEDDEEEEEEGDEESGEGEDEEK